MVYFTVLKKQQQCFLFLLKLFSLTTSTVWLVVWHPSTTCDKAANSLSSSLTLPGTFCTLDICLSRLEDIGTVDINQTVRRMRTQRAFSIQTWDQYYFCYTAVIEYAQRNGKLSPVQWSDSDLDTDSEWEPHGGTQPDARKRRGDGQLES